MKYVVIPGSVDTDAAAQTMVVGTMLENYTSIKYVKFNINDWKDLDFGDMIHVERTKLENGLPSILTVVM